jgi:cytochrome c-type biogenesis protein CcmE
MKPKAIAALVVLVVFSFLLLRSFGGQVGGYMTFEEAERTQAQAHVVGTWVKDGAFGYDRASNVFTFEMLDEKGHRRLVRYHNPKPANFEEAQQVVIEGRAEQGAFVADHILVKCPSKYNDARGLEAAEAART